MKELWVEKYRPDTLKDYVVRDEAQRQQIQAWIKEGAIPHLLLSGAPGVGKTTLAKILFSELKVDGYDILEINASRENSVDTVRDKIINFVQIMPFGAFKYVLLDEADYITPNGQAALRGVMETYHTSAKNIWETDDASAKTKNMSYCSKNFERNKSFFSQTYETQKHMMLQQKRKTCHTVTKTFFKASIMLHQKTCQKYI